MLHCHHGISCTNAHHILCSSLPFLRLGAIDVSWNIGGTILIFLQIKLISAAKSAFLPVCLATNDEL